MNEAKKIRSSLSTGLMRYVLIKGSILAAFGIGLIAYAGTFLDLQTLQYWGWIIYAIGFGLITFGLLPYRKLGRLEKKPHELFLNEEGKLVFYQQGKKTFSIPLDSIEAIDFYPDKYNYGIGISLKETINNKIIIHDAKFDMKRFMTLSQKSHNCDLFLLYFSKRSYESLKEDLKYQLE